MSSQEIRDRSKQRDNHKLTQLEKSGTKLQKAQEKKWASTIPHSAFSQEQVANFFWENYKANKYSPLSSYQPKISSSPYLHQS